jgi:hypothetical protein
MKNTRLQKIACCTFCGLVVMRGLSPFTVQASMNGFNWVPFAGLIEAEDGQHGLLVMLGKVCYYGTAIWTIRSAGVRLRTATAAVVAFLACIEVIQVRLPGRTPETTDPLIAAMLGMAFYAVERERTTSEKGPGVCRPA